MKIRTSIDFLFCCGLFVFWAFFYQYHILFIEQLSFFHYSSFFWKQYSLQPGGWAVYCGGFFAQFYDNRWVGALLQTLLLASLLVFSKNILKKIGVKGGLLFLWILPALILAALQFDNKFTPGDSLVFICPFALAALYMKITNKMIRRLVYLFAIIPVYLFSGMVATCSLYLFCTIYELLSANSNCKLFTHLSIIISKTKQRFNQKKMSAICSFITVSALIFCGSYLFTKKYNRLEEQKFGMSIAASQSNWDNILKISSTVKNPDNHTAYFTNLALSMKGELPNKMFQYSQTDENGLFLVRWEWEEYNLRYGSEFYYRIGILNEAIRWLFDANILRAKGMDYHTLTRLATWNKENGYTQVAEKYFDILEGTLNYRKWAKHQRQTPNPQTDTKQPIPEEYYIGGREPLSDLARHYDFSSQSQMMLDYLLCCLLLKNDLEKFLNLFNLCFPRTMNVPRAYQEALLSIAKMGKIDIRIYPIDQINELRFRSFNDLASKGKMDALQERYGDSWWYYSFMKK